VSTANGHPPTRAERRRVENNTPMPSGVGAAQEGLANVIGQAVAVHLANVLGQILPQMRPQGTACLFCALEAKQALAAYQVACENAQKAAEDIPPPPQPPIQQAFTWSPIAAGPNVPPVAVPVCFDHLQAGPPQRAVGLVLPDGRPIVAQG
jgi:hypothetical protein